jgi:hypothetical protein
MTAVSPYGFARGRPTRVVGRDLSPTERDQQVYLVWATRRGGRYVYVPDWCSMAARPGAGSKIPLREGFVHQDLHVVRAVQRYGVNHVLAVANIRLNGLARPQIRVLIQLPLTRTSYQRLG